LGDVFWHTLPHVLEEQHGGDDHSHYYDHKEDTGSWIIGGFSFFFLVDVLLHMAEDWVSTSREAQSTKTDEKIHKISWSLVVLNVVADALHNFSDGLAIGAAYAGGGSMGEVATLSILLHEVPHELGDYCSLVGAGYTPWQAVQTQFVTAVAALAGTALALVVQQDATHNHALPLATAGGFVYLAGTTIIPHVMHQPVPQPWYRLCHLVAFCVGLAFMYCVAWLEHDDDESHGHHDHDNHFAEL
jgi:zinc transporter 7